MTTKQKTVGSVRLNKREVFIMTQTIKDFSGRIIGYIDEQPNGDKIVKDFYQRVLGKYHKQSNTTRDFYGRVIAQGDASAMLLNKQ